MGLSAPFHTGVAMDLVPQDDWQFTMNLAAGITVADVGKAVELDTSGPNKAKLATDGGHVFGRLLQVEDRTGTGQLVGLVALKFIDELPKTGTVALHESVVGAGAGVVKAATTDDNAHNIVVEVRTSTVVVYQR